MFGLVVIFSLIILGGAYLLTDAACTKPSVTDPQDAC